MKLFFFEIIFYTICFQTPLSFAEKEILPDELPDIYEVKKGDTLSDICEELFNQINCWKKLLSLNPLIKNPNIIQPGMKIQFYPSLRKEEKKESEPLNEKTTNIDAPKNEAEQIVRTLFNHESPATSVKTNFISKDDLKSSHEDIFLSAGGSFNNQSKNIVIPGFIYREKKTSLCDVSFNVDESLFTSEQEEFFCDVKKDSHLANKDYTALRFIAEVSYKDKNFGYFYQFISHVKITKKMTKKDSIFLGKVFESRTALENGDIIIPHITTNKKLFRNEGPLNMTLSAGDILSFDSTDQIIGGEGHFAFLSKGKKDGVREGELLPIYKKSSYQVSEDTKLSHTTPIGKIKIIESNDISSLGFIITNNKEVSIGDEVGVSKE